MLQNTSHNKFTFLIHAIPTSPGKHGRPRITSHATVSWPTAVPQATDVVIWGQTQHTPTSCLGGKRSKLGERTFNAIVVHELGRLTRLPLETKVADEMMPVVAPYIVNDIHGHNLLPLRGLVAQVQHIRYMLRQPRDVFVVAGLDGESPTEQ